LRCDTSTWDAASHAIPTGNVLARLIHLLGALHDWDKVVLKALKKSLRRAQHEFEKAVSGVLSAEREEKAKEMAELIELLLEQEEIRRLQRSRVNSLQHGVRNTNFFHNFATAQRKKTISKELKMMMVFGLKVRRC
jgi:hypothetical protein